jgi:acetate kinase
LIRATKIYAQEASDLLNKKSGVQDYGYSDMRIIRKAINEGDKNAILALEMYAYSIKKT